MVIGQRVRVSRRAAEVPPSPVRKLMPLAFQARARGVKIFHINIGQPDIPTPKPIFDAIRGYDAEVIPYAPSRGYPETLEAWRSYYASQGQSLDVENLIVTTGGSESLWFAFMAVADPGDEILVFEPTYANYFSFARAAGIDVRALPLAADNGFHLPDAAAVHAAITPNTRAVCVANPNNPTGTLYSREEMEMLLDVAEQHDLFLISDETYRELVFDGLKPVSLLDIARGPVTERVIIVDSVSKRFSATGVRVGCLVSLNAEVMDGVGRFAQARLSSPTVEQLAVVPMLNDPISYTTWLRGVYESRRDAVYERLNAAGLGCRKPSAAFYVMATLPVDDTDRFAAWLLSDFETAGETVMIAPGGGFYLSEGLGVDQARIAYVLNEEDLGRSIDILGEALAKYPGART